jgi:predicted DCC family thiol-disulfide oxidoreductase YuxK
MISLTSDLTDSKGRHARGWLFFDAECEFCRRTATWLKPRLRGHGVAMAPLQDPRVSSLLGVSREELLLAIRYLANGVQYLGADALLALARELWWAQPLVWVSRVPGVLPGLRAAYQWQAQRRKCQAQFCTGANSHGQGDARLK